MEDTQEDEEISVTKPVVKIFWSYAHENKKTRDALERHLGALKHLGQIAMWHDQKILPGTSWEEEIQKRLKSSDLVLPLISDHFLNSHYCWDVEMRFAFEQWKEGKIAIVPVLVNSVDYQGTLISDFQVLPTEGKAINCWSDPEKAYTDIAVGIRKVVETLLAKKWDQRGYVWYRLSQYDLALSAYEEAILLDPCNPSFHCDKANALLKLRQYEEAIKIYDAAIELKSDLGLAFQGKGLAFEGFAPLAREYYKKLAKQAFQKANELDGGNKRKKRQGGHQE